MTAFEILNNELAAAAIAEIRDLVPEAIVNHSIRTCVLAFQFALSAGYEIRTEELVIAALLHDSGSVADDSAERFEVVSADSAASFAADAGLNAKAQIAIWDAVALHTSAGIAERHRPLTRALRDAVKMDFSNRGSDLEWHLAAELEGSYPRLNIEVVLGDAIVSGALARPEKAPPASWPRDLLRGAEIGGAGRVNPFF